MSLGIKLHHLLQVIGSSYFHTLLVKYNQVSLGYDYDSTSMNIPVDICSCFGF